MWLFFGCRQKEMDLYRTEKAEMVEKKVLDRVFLALSREPHTQKVVLQVAFFHQLFRCTIDFRPTCKI